jgi:hypothetical protein
MKSQIPNPKSQIPNKFKVFKASKKCFEILEFEYCLEFGIWNLEF